jgi:hypothetical protein
VSNVQIDQRIPELSDKELENLHANALRLAQSGTQRQREQAESLLPLLSAELEQRRAARVQTQQENRRSNAKQRAAVNATLKANFD